jgi:cob(I)alamin adenosyltransferase
MRRIERRIERRIVEIKRESFGFETQTARFFEIVFNRTSDIKIVCEIESVTLSL